MVRSASSFGNNDDRLESNAPQSTISKPKLRERIEVSCSAPKKIERITNEAAEEEELVEEQNARIEALLGYVSTEIRFLSNDQPIKLLTSLAIKADLKSRNSCIFRGYVELLEIRSRERLTVSSKKSLRESFDHWLKHYSTASNVKY